LGEVVLLEGLSNGGGGVGGVIDPPWGAEVLVLEDLGYIVGDVIRRVERYAFLTRLGCILNSGRERMGMWFRLCGEGDGLERNEPPWERGVGGKCTTSKAGRSWAQSWPPQYPYYQVPEKHVLGNESSEGTDRRECDDVCVVVGGEIGL
jgi:hypothetical protein